MRNEDTKQVPQCPRVQNTITSRIIGCKQQCKRSPTMRPLSLRGPMRADPVAAVYLSWRAATEPDLVCPQCRLACSKSQKILR
eukprot:4686302-Amphidinium_carterae.1